MVTRSKSLAPATDSAPLTRVYAWFSALVAEDTALLDDLLAHGVAVDVLHPLRHTTALMESTRLGRTAIIEWLLSHGAAPAFLCGTPAGTSLHCALRRGYWQIAEMLIEHMESAAVMDAYGRTPLHLLSMESPLPNHPDHRFTTVTDTGHTLTTKLIEKACPLDALDHEGITALHHCVINDNIELAEILLAHGAKVDSLIPDSWVSPLMIAALEKNYTMANLLLSYKANPHQQTRDGLSPLTICPELLQIIR
jgi:ankyrin repeat protein